LKRLESAFNTVRQGIFTRLHDVVRDQIFLPQPGAQLPESSAQLPEAIALAEAVPPIDPSVDSARKSAMAEATALILPIPRPTLSNDGKAFCFAFFKMCIGGEMPGPVRLYNPSGWRCTHASQLNSVGK